MADDLQIKREIVLEADAETLERMRRGTHRRRKHSTASIGVFRSLGGILTTDANFPVRGNAQDSYRQSKGVRDRSIQK